MDQTVTSFRVLLQHDPKLSPGESQQRARRLLPELVGHSALGWWVSGRPLPTTSRLLLVGVAVWSGYDLTLLDHLDRAVSDGANPGLHVYVFDVDESPSQETFSAIFPGIGFVHHTPVVGHWEGGELIEKACGFDGRQIVARLLGIDEQLLHQPATAAS
jgi:hypothetical protein